MATDEAEPPKPPVIDGAPARPDVPEVRRDSLGRVMDPSKPRGRKPGTQGAAAPKQQQTHAVLQSELKKRLPADPIAMTDENVGKAIAGAFGAIGIFGGPHWRLMQKEQREWGEMFGPLARMYGPEELAKWIMVLMTLPLVTSTIVPRIAIQSMIQKGEIAKETARTALIQVKTMAAAENALDIEKQVMEGVAESNAYLRAQVQAAQEVTTEMKAQEIVKEGVVNGTTVAPEASPSAIDIPGDPNA